MKESQLKWGWGEGSKAHAFSMSLWFSMTRSIMLLLPCLPSHDGLYPLRTAKLYSSFLTYIAACQVFGHSIEKGSCPSSFQLQLSTWCSLESSEGVPTKRLRRSDWPVVISVRDCLDSHSPLWEAPIPRQVGWRGGHCIRQQASK